MSVVKKYLLCVLKLLLPRWFGIGSGFGRLARQRQEIIVQSFMYTDNEKVQGDYLEFGVARGQTLVFAYKAMRKYCCKVESGKLLGFDSFEGFPAPQGPDAINPRFQQGEEYHGGISATRKVLKRFGADAVTLIPGWYQDTLHDETRQQYGIKRARVINIDCDLYESALQALLFVTPALQTGTVILFDDWFCYRADPARGEQRAVSEWQAMNPHITLMEYRGYANVGKSFIVHIDEDAAGRSEAQ